jgi:hypothetical protein
MDGFEKNFSPLSRLLIFALLIVDLLVASTALAEAPPSHDRKDTEPTPFAVILSRVVRKTGFVFRGIEALEGEVSRRFSGPALNDDLRRLLAHLDYVLVEESLPWGGTRPTLLLIFGPSTAQPATGNTGRIAIGDVDSGPLTSWLTDPDPVARQWAVKQLGQNDGEWAFAHLLGSLEDDNPDVRQAALDGLGRYGASAVEPLKALLKRETVPEVRVAALQLLGQVGEEEAVDVLRTILRDRDLQIRVAAVEALGHVGSPSATEALIKAAKDRDPAVRMAALNTLAFYVSNGLATSVVREALFDADEGVQALARDLTEAGSE